MSERERFEAWASSAGFDVRKFSAKQAYPPGTYTDSRTHAAWAAWQAARSGQAASGSSQGARSDVKNGVGQPEAPTAAPLEPATEWRCFHCDEVFTEHAAALEHFGASELQSAMCCISPAHVRWLEEQHHRNVQDDSDALRSMRSWASEHEDLRRKAEELGYARGLSDAKKHPEDIGLAHPPARSGAGSEEAQADRSEES